MNSLSDQQKELLFDYCLGLTSEEQNAEVEGLISHSQEAAELQSRLKSVLNVLDCVGQEPCPDHLTDRTIRRLKECADSGHRGLERLLETEQAHRTTIRIGFWRNLSEVAAVAAVIMLVAAIMIPSLSFARQKGQQRRCLGQYADIHRGLSNYISDHDGQLPRVATAVGSPWWKVGYQGKENHSNTRPVWLLAKGNYVEPAKFVCPGTRRAKTLKLEALDVRKYNDFPNRDYVSYSFRIRCDKGGSESLRGRKVLMADLNPLSENLPRDFSKPFKLRLSEKILTLNSINHRRRGQNVLFCDGSAEFTKARHVGISADDIYSLQQMSSGCEVTGCELPSCESDAFVAP
ncbi:MAG: hypothetical protein JSU70_02620 [Phycisphaerales bacterium]|nr:MAG: hypothetical protein JSU70_02620 [Phycisphaerales bacterium]